MGMTRLVALSVPRTSSSQVRISASDGNAQAMRLGSSSSTVGAIPKLCAARDMSGAIGR